MDVQNQINTSQDQVPSPILVKKRDFLTVMIVIQTFSVLPFFLYIYNGLTSEFFTGSEASSLVVIHLGLISIPLFCAMPVTSIISIIKKPTKLARNLGIVNLVIFFLFVPLFFLAFRVGTWR